MPVSLAKLSVVILLAVQGWVALFNGRPMCIPVGACARHAAESSFDSIASLPVGQPADHTDTSPALGFDHEDCGCHIHLPSISHTQISHQPRSSVDVPAIVVAAIASSPAELNVIRVGLDAPTRSLAHASPALHVLRATRLLI